MRRAREYRLVVQAYAPAVGRGIWDIPGIRWAAGRWWLDGYKVIAAEEMIPPGWGSRVDLGTRDAGVRLVEQGGKGMRNFCSVYGITLDRHKELHPGCGRTRRARLRTPSAGRRLVNAR